jgi:hypothetical protein
MKKETRSSERRFGSLGAVVWLFAGLLLMGCSSTSFKKGDATSESLQAVASAVQTESEELRATVDSLHDLVHNPASDLQPQFKSYDKSLDRLYSSIERTDTRMKRMQKKSAAYFTAWDDQLAAMNYEVIRNRSEARKEAVTNTVAFVTQRYHQTREVLLPLVAYFEDMRKQLGTDLTADGLAAVKDLVVKTEENTGRMQIALTQLISDLTESSGRLASVGVTGLAPGSSASPVEAQGGSLDAATRRDGSSP